LGVSRSLNNSVFKEGKKMAEPKKEGLFKRLFGGKKAGCCGVKIEEVKKEGGQEKLESIPSSGCCSPDTKKA
jgi:hypothetical protein